MLVALQGFSHEHGVAAVLGGHQDGVDFRVGQKALVVCCAVLNGVLGRLDASAQAFRAGDGFDLSSGLVQFGQDGGPCEVACANDTKHRFAWIVRLRLGHADRPGVRPGPF